jgi:hypothetical protein
MKEFVYNLPRLWTFFTSLSLGTKFTLSPTGLDAMNEQK